MKPLQSRRHSQAPGLCGWVALLAAAVLPFHADEFTTGGGSASSASYSTTISIGTGVGGIEQTSLSFTSTSGPGPELLAGLGLTPLFGGLPPAIADNAATDENTILSVNTEGGLLSNFIDAGTGEPAGFSITAHDAVSRLGSTVVVNANGSFTYDPRSSSQLNALPGGITVEDSFNYTPTATAGGHTIETLIVRVTGVNDLPQVVPASAVTIEDTAASIILSGTDAENDSLTFAIVTQPTRGVLSGTPPNLTYVPNSNANGADSFSYKANDGHVDSLGAVVSITITTVNDSPTAIPQNVVTSEDTSKIIQLTGSDVENSSLIFQILTQPGKGVLSGTIPNLTYSPLPNISGTDSFTFRVSDGAANSSVAIVSISIIAVNDPPVANSLIFSTDEDNPKAITLAGSDEENSPLSFTVLNPPGNGTLSGTAPNLVFVPRPNLNGSDSFTFAVNDGTSDSAPATVGITINSINDAPAAVGQSVVTDQNAPKTISLSGSDTENSSLTFSVLTEPGKGTLSGNAPNLTYTPGANLIGSDSFTFRVNDGALNSGPATVLITINAVSDLISIGAIDDQTTAEDTAKPIDFAVTLNGTIIGALNVSASSSNPTLVPDENLVVGGSGNDRTLAITPAANRFGQTTITLLAEDEAENSTTRSFLLTVSPVNDLPAAGDQRVVLLEDQSAAIRLEATDVENNPLTYFVVDAPDKGTLSGTAPDLAYTPNANSNGSDSFTFFVNDGNGNSELAVVYLAIDPLNDSPTLNIVTGQTVAEDSGELVIPLTGISAGAPDETQTITVTAASGNGSVIGNPVVEYNNPEATGTLKLAPIPNAVGESVITLTVRDDGGMTHEGRDTLVRSFVVTVTAENDFPVIGTIGNQTINEDTRTGVIAFTVGDIETLAGQLTLAGQSSNPSLIGPGGIIFGGSGANRTVTVTPAADQSGTATITVTVRDGAGAETSQSFVLTVLGINDLPTIGLIAPQVTEEDTTSTVSFAVGDLESEAQNLTLSVQSSNAELIDQSGITFGGIGSNRTATLSPKNNQFGSATITVTVRDGGAAERSRSFLFTVNGVNDFPAIELVTSQATDEDTAKIVSFTISDPESEAGGLTVSGQSSNPVLVANSDMIFGGGGASRTLTLSPAANRIGLTTITLSVSDGQGGETRRSFELTVTPVNDVPVANGQNVVTDQNAPKAIPLAGSDVENSVLAFTVLTQPAKGTLSGAAPNLIYTPNANATGSDSLTFKVNDGAADSTAALVRITINAVSDLISIGPIGSQLVLEDTAKQVNFTIVLHGTVIGDLSVSGSSSNPTLVPDENLVFGGTGAARSMIITPAAHQNGTATITLTVSDESGNATSRGFVLNVSPVNDRPAANGQNVVLNEDQTATIRLGGEDIENDPLTFRVFDPPRKGTLSGTAPNLTYVPNPDVHGSDSFTFVVNDGTGDSAPAAVNLNIEPVNDPPTLNVVADRTIAEDSSELEIPVSGITPGLLDGAQTITFTASSSNASLVAAAMEFSNPNGTGTLRLTPAANGNGESTITMTVRDNGGIARGGSDTLIRSFTVTVSQVNDRPVISPISDQNIDEDNESGAIVFQVGDVETQAGQLTVSGESSNPNLIDSSRIVFGGSSVNRSVTLRPRADQSGTATVTVRVRDEAGAESSRSFVLSVQSVNDTPTIGVIAAQTGNEDSPTTVSFNVTDVETAAANLVLSGASSNSSLVPNGNLAFGGIGTSRTVTVSPLAHVSGTTTITMTVDDGEGGNDTRSFEMTINAVNDAPVATTQNVVTDQNAATAITLTGKDVENSPLSFSVLTQPAKGVLSGTVPDLIYTPAANVTGNDSFSFKVNDGTSDSGAATIAITINAVSDLIAIGAITDQSTPEDTATGVDVSITLNGTVIGSLSMGARSSNQALIPDSNLILGGSGNARRLVMTPAANVSGEATITVTVSDESGNRSTRSFLLGVTAVNDLPVASHLSIAGLEDQPVTLVLQGSDVENDPLTFSIVSHPTQGTLVGAPPNLTYDPNPSANGTDSFTFDATDGGGKSVPATVDLKIEAVNDPPALNTVEDQSIDEDSGELVITLSGLTTGAADEVQTITVSAVSDNMNVIGLPLVQYTSPESTGVLRLTPAANASGEALITVTVGDDGGSASGGLDTFTRSFNVTVTGVNDAPTLSVISSQTIDEDATSPAIGFTVGDLETDASQLTLSAVSSDQGLIDSSGISFGGNGTVRTLTLKPLANQSGTATVMVTVGDDSGAEVARSFPLTVREVNDAPVIGVISSQTTSEETARTVSFSVDDLETAVGSLIVTASSSNLTLVPDGSLVFGGSGVNRSVTAVPLANQNGTTTITITATDEEGAQTNQSFDLSVTAVNDVPVADSQNVVLDQNVAKTLTLTGSDIENSALSFTILAQPTKGTLSGTAPNLTYTPSATGSDTFSFTVNDGTEDSTPGTVQITINAVSDVIGIGSIGDQSSLEDTAKQVDFTITDNGAVGTLAVSASSSNPFLASDANVAIGGTGLERSVVFTPAADQFGETTITVNVSDDAGNATSRSFVLTVSSVNDAPVAVAQSISTQEDVLTSIRLVSTDAEGDPLTFQVVVDPTQGTLTGTAPNVTYTPNADANGSDSFSFTANDGSVDSAVGIVDLAITPVNDAPTLDAITDKTINEDSGEFVVNLSEISSGAVDETQTLTVTAVSSDESVIAAPVLEYISPEVTGTLKFTPAANANGEATITVTVQDNGGTDQGGIDSFTQRFAVNVNSVNDLPTIASIADQTFDEDTALGSIAIAIGDVETDASQLSLRAQSSNAQLIDGARIGFAGTGASRTLTLAPVEDQSGTATITVTVLDEVSGESSTSFLLTVRSVNDAPALGAIRAQTTNEDTAKTVSLTVGDVETATANLILSGVSSDTNLLPDANLVFGGSGSSRTVTATPLANLSGTATITITVDDGQGGQASQSFDLTVNAVNDSPAANIQNVVTDQNVPASITLTGSDVENGALTFSVVTQPSSGVLSGTAPNLVYTPNANVGGADSFTFKVNDGEADSVGATVQITINTVSELLSIAAITDQSTPEDTATAVAVAIVLNGTVIGDLSLTTGSSNPDLVPDANIVEGGSDLARTLAITPVANQSGETTISVSVSDESGNKSSRSFILNVKPVNDVPAALAQSVSVVEDLAHSLVLQGSDAENDPLTFRVVSEPAKGTLTGTAPSLTYTPNPNANGSDSFAFDVNDGTDDSTPSVVSLEIEAVNDSPTLDAIADQTISEDSGEIAISLSGISSGASDETQGITMAAISDNPSVVATPVVEYSSPESSGTLKITPAVNTSGEAVITVMVGDDGGTQQAGIDMLIRTFKVIVDSVNDLPTVSAIADQTIDEDTSSSVIALTVGDVETSASLLSVSGSSSNPNLIATEGIVFGGSAANRTVTLTPLANQAGTATITVKARDAAGGEGSANFILTVQTVNDPPTISVIGAQSTAEDAVALIDITVGDIETAVGSLALSGISSNAAVVENAGLSFGGSEADRTVTVTPAANQTGTTTITITVADGQGGQRIESFDLTVTAVNDAPAAISQNVVTDQNAAKSITLSGSDVENSLLAFTVLSQPGKGVLTGTVPALTYTPNSNETGVDSFTFKVNDGTVDSGAATVQITINAVSDLIAIGLIADQTTQEDTVDQVEVTITDNGAIGNLSVSGSSSNPALVPNANVVAEGTGLSRSVVITPVANGFGETTITVTVSDESGNSSSRSFGLTVAPVNDLPVAGGQTVSTVEDETLSLQMQGSDVENDPLSFQIISNPALGTLSGTAPNLIFTPNKDFNGSDSFTFLINDGSGDSAAATVNVTIEPVNDAPELTHVSNVTIAEDSGELVIDLSGISAGFSNETQGITVSAISDNESVIGVPGVDYTSPDSTGSLRLSPVGNANGEATIALTVTDDGGTARGGIDTLMQSFTVSVSPVNDPPTISALDDQAVSEDSSSNEIGISIGDIETDAGLLSLSAQSSNVNLIGQDGIELGGSGASRTVKLTPTLDEAGTATITIKVRDSEGAESTETFVLTVNGVNDLPVIGEITGQVIDEGSATGTILFTVSDRETAADELELTASSSNQTIVSDGNIALGGAGSNRTVTITPAANGVGVATITITVRDTDGGTVELSFGVTINGVNDVPTLAAIADQTIEEDAGTQTLTLTGISAGTGEDSQQVVTITAASDTPNLIGDPVVDYASPSGTGTLSYTPRANAVGTAVLSVIVRDDGGTPNGGIDTVTNVFNVTVNAVNDAPVLAAITDQTINEETLLTVIADATNVESVTETLVFSLDPGAPAGASIDPTTGVVSWTPGETEGPGDASVTIRVTDNGTPPLSVTQSFGVSIFEVNVGPVMAAIGGQSVAEGSSLNFGVSATDADFPANSLTFALGSGAPLGASISSGGSFSWTPTEEQGPGSYSMSIEVSDNSAPALTAVQGFTVTVGEVNQAPFLALIADRTVDEGGLVSLQASASDPDLPSQTLTYSLGVGVPAGASINSATGAFSWTPSEGQGPGTHPITINVSDNGSPSQSVSQNFNVSVNEVNVAPFLATISDQSVSEGEIMSAFVAGADLDQPAQQLTFSLGEAPSGVSIDPDSGTVTWTPTESQGGTTSLITVVLTDNGPGNLSSSQSFQAVVLEVNTAPVLGEISDRAVKAGSPLTVSISGTDPDIPTDNLTYSLPSGGPVGALIDPVSGLFSWTPDPLTPAGTIAVTIQATDNGSPPLSATTSFAIEISAGNSSPDLVGIGDQTVDEGTLLTVNVSASDPDGHALNYSLDPGAPTEMAIDPASGVLSWTPGEEHGPGSSSITVRVTDNGTPPLSVTQSFGVVVNEVNTPPVLAAIGDENAEVGVALDLTVSANDADLPPNSLTYELGPGAPAGAVMDPLTGAFLWTPTLEQSPSTNVIIVRVIDDGIPSLTTEVSFAIVVAPNNRAPVAAVVVDQTIPEQTILSISMAASDPDQPAQELVYELNGAPSGASIDSATGLLLWTPEEAQGPSTHNISVTVTDNGNPPLSATSEFSVIVEEVNQAPVLESIGDQRLEQGSLLTLAATATDLDLPANQLSFSLDADAPAGASMGAATGAFTWTPNAQQVPSTNLITIRVTDDGVPALIAEQNFTVVVTTVNTAPVLEDIGTQIVDEGQLLTFTALGTDTDLPAQTLVYSLAGQVPSGAAIDTTNGLFTFTPAEAQGPRTNLFSVRVTDDGIPPLRTSQDVTLVVSEVNSAPVLSAIADQTLGVGDTLTLPTQATDGDLPANTLAFSLGSGAPAGAAIDSITGILSWTTTAAQASTTNQVTVRVTDNGVVPLNDAKTFTAIVGAGANVPPTISSIADQTTPENTPTASITFTVNDPDTPIGNLSLTAVSSDTALVPAENIVIGGNELNRTVQITPTRNMTGSTSITIDVSEPAGGRASVSFELTVVPTPPGILRQPADSTVLGGSVLNLSVLATGSAPLNYQWSFEGEALGGETDSVLSLPNAQPENAGQYVVEVSNRVGSVTSRAAQVEVNVLLRITEQPVSQNVLAGGSATFRVGAIGAPPLSYQWSVNGATVPGGTFAVLSLENVEPILAGSYSVEVSDAGGSVTSRSAVLDVLTPAQITAQPASLSVLAGVDAAFSVSADGTPPLGFQWFYNGVNLADETNSSLSLQNVGADNSGSYTVVVSNSGGSVMSEGAQLTVSLPPTITRQPQGQSVLAGATVNLGVTVSATPPLIYQWQFNGGDISDATRSSLALNNVTSESAGEYTVVASNTAGSVTSQAAVVEVTQPVTITVQPQAQTVVEGASTSFSVTATGSAPLSYQWRKGGVNLADATNATIALNNVRPVDAGNYQVVVRNGAGPVSSTPAALTVNTGVRIITEPQSQSLTNGSNASFTVTASGTVPLTYQWRFNGADIAGATTADLGLPAIQPSDAGNYSVVVANAVGSVPSTEAVLNVLIPPVIQTHPASQTVDLASSAAFSVVATGDEPLQYQWQLNGGNIAGETDATLVLSTVQAADAGSYSVVVQNRGGAVSSQAAALTLNLPPLTTGNSAVTAPPPIEQPEGTFDGGDTTSGGGQIARRNQSPSDGGGRWFAWRAPGSGIATFSTSGSTFDTVLAIFTGTSPDLVEIASDDDRGGFLSSQVRFNAVQGTTYLINVKGFGGATGQIIVSFSLNVTAQRLPVLAGSPQSTVAREGGVVTFSVEASGTDLIYQWLADGVEIGGATGSSLVLSNIQERDALNYSVRVTSGMETVESLPASLQVGTIDALTQDKFKNATGSTSSTRQLAGARSSSTPRSNVAGVLQQAASIARLVFSTRGSAKEQGEPNHCEEIGGASRWMKYVAAGDGVVRFSTEGSDFDTVLAVYSGSGTSFSTLTLEGCDNNSGTDGLTSVVAIRVVGGRTYYVAVDGVGGSSGLVTLSYEAGQKPSFSLQPASQSVKLGSSAVFFVLTASGTDLSYQWFKDGLEMAGQSQPSLQFLSVVLEDVGQYTVVASSFAGSVRSDVAELAVNVPLSLSVPPVDQEAGIGGLARFAVDVSGSEPITYQWSLDGVPIAGATEPVYEVGNVQIADAGSYVVNAQNAAGTIESDAVVLTIPQIPVITAAPESVSVVLGAEAILSVSAGGTGQLSYQWRFNGLDIAGAIEPSLLIQNVGPQAAGDYTIVVSNGTGSTISTPAKVSVRVPLRLVENPRSQEVTIGSSAVFAVQASGAGPYSYQWKLDGIEIPGATSATYILTNSQEIDSGGYTVVVTSQTETVESEAAILTVNALPAITLQPRSQVVFAGTEVTLEISASGTAPISYQWAFEGESIDGETSNILMLPAFEIGSVGAYSVVVSNAAGSVESELAVITLGEIVSDPRLSAAGFEFRLNVPEGTEARVQFTTDFQIWTDLNPTPLTGTGDVTDSDAIALEFRFYRVIIE